MGLRHLWARRPTNVVFGVQAQRCAAPAVRVRIRPWYPFLDPPHANHSTNAKAATNPLIISNVSEFGRPSQKKDLRLAEV